MKKEGIHWDQISAYIEGRMTPAEAHAFELEMQSDAFLSDAVDGLMQESAASRKQALQALQALRATSRNQPPCPAGGKSNNWP